MLSRPKKLLLRMPDSARGDRHAGFTLVEIIVVVLIITILISILLVGAGQWIEKSKSRQTRVILETLDAVIDEYHSEASDYFDDKVENVNDFLDVVQGMGDIPNMIGGLRNDTWTTDDKTVFDAWDTPLQFRNPQVSPRITDLSRPWFWSLGPDQTNNSGDDGQERDGDENDDLHTATGGVR